MELDRIKDFNYNIQLPKITAMIQQWKRRILTPIGRDTVAKSLIVQHLNHLFISLPNPYQKPFPSSQNCFLTLFGGQYVIKIKRVLWNH